MGHTVVNRPVILGALSLGLDLFWRLGQEPCAVNVLETDGRRFVLVSMNETGHLLESGEIFS